MFVAALLDVTDNLVGGEVVPPERVVRHDGDDPYLVVAADKGTATFSDIANAISRSCGFWLGDAFASGGSAGYDHKEMGITARGAWESVQAALPRARRRHADAATSRWSASVTCPATCSATACCSPSTSSSWRRSTTATSSSTRTPIPRPASPSASGCSSLPRSSWADYDPALISAAAASFRARPKSVALSPRGARARSACDGRAR